ncbi:MAG: short-chain dehydrogenase [Solirubrobacterales bacterium]|jgi:NAD(P)-dependent dehydrogenase (short-subunit alcohol dehydrogenase family)|nr:short-chain dehydrogenase [Solirubrobacterales bacterium]
MSATDTAAPGSGLSFDLEGKRCLVTGAARGLGLAVATLFVQRGAHVMLCDIDEAAVRAAAGELGEKAAAVRCDVTRAADVQAAIDATVGAFGGLDVLVNNAGIEIGKPLHEISEEEYDALMAINVKGVWLGMKHAVPALAATRGAIVNMASVAGLGGVPLLGVYCASKAAVLRLTQTAAVELRETGIRVNAVCPAFIDTQMVERLVAPFEAATQSEFGDVVAIKQARLGTADEVAETVAFLASDASSFVTGSQYVLDNALTASVL